MILKIILFVLAVSVISIMLMNLKFYPKLKKVSANRPPLSKESYISILVQRGYDSKLVEKAYEFLRSQVPEKYSIYPEDDIVALYDPDEADMNNFLEELDDMKKLYSSREIKSSTEKKSKVFTVEDMLS